MPEARFRPNVCIVVKKKGKRKLLLCHRKGFTDSEGWQFPQGGIDTDVDLISEMKRELREEIGTDKVIPLKISPKQYAYTFPAELVTHPKGYAGQIQRWVLVEVDDDSGISFNHEPAEFDAFQWVGYSMVLGKIVDFKKEVYTQAMHDLGLI